MLVLGLLVAHIKPFVPPSLDGLGELDIEVGGEWINMYSATTYVINQRARCGLTLQFKNTFEKTKVRLDSEPALAESDETGDVKERIWEQLVELEPIETQKTPKKGVKRQGKTANDECKKHHSITSRRHRNGLTTGDARIGD